MKTVNRSQTAGCIGRTALLSAALMMLGGCASTHLRLARDPLRIAVDQRSALGIPGSDGSVQLKLGDITRGRVLVSIQDRHRRPVTGEFAVGVNDIVPFHIGNRQFYLKVIELRNLATGVDYGVIEISRKKPKSRR